jgi:Mn2+/Fe2+ NRAMP family transporter
LAESGNREEDEERSDTSADPQLSDGEPASGPRETAVECEPNAVKRFFKILGPGLVTGASDDDPSGIGTYAVAGASLGYSTLWTALFPFPMMTAIQYICAKIAMVTGMGLARVLREHYSKALLYPVVGG